MSKNKPSINKLSTHLIILLLAFNFSSSKNNSTKSEKVESESNQIVDNINHLRDVFFKYVDENLMEEVQVIINKVQEPTNDATHAALNGKEKLKFLAKKHLQTFANITSTLKDLESIVDEVEDEVLLNIALMRSKLEITTLFSPLEYFGHKFGFTRNNKIK
ncbi:hypothetical protein ACFFRR_007319 [Megaselia abdita]